MRLGHQIGGITTVALAVLGTAGYFLAGGKAGAQELALLGAAVLVSAVVVERTVSLLLARQVHMLRGAIAGEAGGTPAADLLPLLEAHRQVRSSLEGTVAHALKAVHDMAASTTRLHQMAEQNQRDLDEQQAETEQVATAMNEMSATVEEVARHAAEAAEAAGRANAAAARGGEIAAESRRGIDDLVGDVDDAAQVIGRLEEQSGRIEGILNVIKEIAEQTNLLALNAAIEAARAGEQGRGFAVVADAVRTQASRTQQSTAEIEEMIGQLQGGVRESVSVMERAVEKGRVGSGRVADTVAALEEIVESVATIDGMNTQIATAAEEQSQVANEINRNITNISGLAEQTSLHARETCTLTEELAGVTQKLVVEVGASDLSLGAGLDLSNAKAAHLNWVTRLRRFLDGGETLTREQAVSHHHCDFGKWYYGKGLKQYGHLAPLREVEKPHEDLHRLIRDIIEAKEAGNLAAAEAGYQKVSNLSGQIVSLLEAAEREAAPRH